MKILHVIGSDTDGGAAKGVINLHKLLLSKKIDSYIYFGYCNTKSNYPFLNIVLYGLEAVGLYMIDSIA